MQTPPIWRTFASDNAASVHPAIMEAVAQANYGHAGAYGSDTWTAQAVALFQQEFGPQAEVFLVMNGTGANVTGIGSVLRPYQAIICAQTAHLNEDECGAPEGISGSKLLTIPSENGKISPEQVLPFLYVKGVTHKVQPAAVSITQSTEYGTVYQPAEIRALAEVAHQHGLLLHMDGARIANAAAALGCSFAELTTHCGVDILSFGATKNGLMMGEVVVFLKPGLSEHFPFYRKQFMQLASKMRYLSAQFIPYFTQGIWKENALHANRMARLLAAQVRDLPGITITHPVEANAVFACLPEQVIAPLQAYRPFYVWNPAICQVRWMTSFDTTEQDVLDFAAHLRDLLATV